MYEISPDYMPHNETISTYKWASERNLFYLALVLVITVLVFRRPDAFLMPQFHAEEGRNFFADAYNQGWSSLFNTINGYFHLFPRLIILLSLSLTSILAHQPTIYMIVTVACYLALVLFIFKRFPGNSWQKFFASLVVFFIPLGNEILMNQTNIQWFGALFIYLMFFTPDLKSISSRISIGSFLLILILFSFTGPFSLLLLPLVIFRYVKSPDCRLPTAYYLILLCSSLFTLYSLLSYGTIDRTDGAFELLDRGFVQHFFFQYTFFIFSKFVHDVPFWLMALSSAGIILIFIVWITKGERIRRYENNQSLVTSDYLLVTSLWFVLITFISYRFDPGALSPFYCAIRNYFLPAVFLCWALIIKFGHSRFFIPTSAFFILWFFFQTYLFIKPYRFEDMKWKEEVKRIGQADSTVIPINPKGWTLVLKRK